MSGVARPTQTGELQRAVSTAGVLGRHALGTLHQVARGRPRSAALAVELRRAFEELGPTYVKLGQIIASSPGLFPEVLSEEFRACLDRVPPAPYESVRRVIMDDLGAPPEVIFAAFEEVPIASASVAQVHAATLDGGREVVVKVQRPDIRPRLTADLAVLRRVARLLERTSTGRMANPVAVLEDFERTLGEELDFEREGRSMETFEANLRAFGDNDLIRVPEVVWEQTSRRVLTMERIHGYKVDDWDELLERGWDLQGLLKRGVRAWMEGALVHGFFHGDVHAGNLMVDTEGRVVFLDFGIMGSLEDHVRNIVRRGLPALLVRGDYEEVAKAIYEMGAVLKPADLKRSSEDIARIVKPILGKPLSEISYGKVLTDIIRIGTSYDVRLPRELVLVSKQLLYFERYAKRAAPDWAILGDPDLLGFLFEGLDIPVLSDPRMAEDPFPTFRAMRAQGPVARTETGGVVVTGYEQASAVLTDHETFSSEIGEYLSPLLQARLGEPSTLFGAKTMLFADPPDHERLRRVVGRAFTPKAVSALEPRIRELTAGLLEPLRPGVPYDVMAELAWPLPVTVIAEMLGIPVADREDFKRWSDDLVAFNDWFGGEEALRRAEASASELRDYLIEKIWERADTPGEDLISRLVAANEDGILDQAELVGACMLLLVAGNETTTKLIGNGVIALARYPEQRDRLVADPSLLANAVEELLRYEGVVTSTVRIARRETELDGVVVPRGGVVFVVLGATNRDPQRFGDAEWLDVGREDAAKHHGFGHGIHYCLGAPLGRLETRVVLEELLARAPDYRLMDEGVEYGTSTFLRGPERVAIVTS